MNGRGEWFVCDRCIGETDRRMMGAVVTADIPFLKEGASASPPLSLALAGLSLVSQSVHRILERPTLTPIARTLEAAAVSPARDPRWPREPSPT
jgi:hypothetical protein